MADVNKSVEITLRANIKQLQDSLESIPNMTKAEAQAMTRALSAEFNKAQKAAKKAAEESQKAAKATSAAYSATSKDVGASFDRMAQDASSSAQEIKISFADAAGETNALSEGAETLGTSMGAATLAVDKLIPGLDDSAKKALEMADGLATAAEQAIKGGPVTMALTAAVVAMAAGYHLATKAEKENLVVIKEQLTAYQGLQAEIRMATDAARAFSSAENESLKAQRKQAVNDEYDAMLEIELVQGRITQKQYELQKIRNQEQRELQDIGLQHYRANERRKEEISALEEKLKMLDKEKRLNNDLIMNSQATTEEKKEAKKRSDEITEETQRTNDAIKRINTDLRESNTLHYQAEEALKAQFAQEKKLVQAKDAQNKRLEEQKKIQEELQKQRDFIMSLEEQATESQKVSRDIMVSVLPMEDQIAARAQERSAELAKQIKSIESQVALMQATADTEDKRLQLSVAEEQAIETIAALKEEQSLVEQDALIKLQELRDANSDKTKQNIADENELRKQAIQEQIEHLNLSQEATIGTFRNMTDAIGAITKATGQENAGLVRALFEMNKIASLGEVAFNTAKAITAAQVYPPPLNGIMIASAIASGAAQTAVVMSQQAPKFHMGGMTPDESIAVVKSGEAVLDRATVNRLGGEPGVNRLQNGGSSAPQVIVTNPYKHFDRYMTDRQRAGLSMRSAKRGY